MDQTTSKASSSPSRLLRLSRWLVAHGFRLSWNGSVACVRGWRWSIPLIGAILVMIPQNAPPPKNPDNLCEIFAERPEWVAPALAAHEFWDVPVYVLMAIMYQESSFIANARPPWYKWMGVVPLYRMSSAYGYSQALDQTWQRYQDERGRWFASRTRFDDAIDFIGWYNTLSLRVNDIPLNNAQRLYLAYHEGHRGYARKTWAKKPWLQKVAEKVARRADLYKLQMQQCPNLK